MTVSWYFESKLLKTVENRNVSYLYVASQDIHGNLNDHVWKYGDKSTIPIDCNKCPLMIITPHIFPPLVAQFFHQKCSIFYLKIPLFVPNIHIECHYETR